jgi:hypothetical protein
VVLLSSFDGFDEDSPWLVYWSSGKVSDFLKLGKTIFFTLHTPLWPWKGQRNNPGVMSCILTRWLWDVMIRTWEISTPGHDFGMSWYEPGGTNMGNLDPRPCTFCCTCWGWVFDLRQSVHHEMLVCEVVNNTSSYKFTEYNGNGTGLMPEPWLIRDRAWFR